MENSKAIGDRVDNICEAIRSRLADFDRADVLRGQGTQKTGSVPHFHTNGVSPKRGQRI